MGKELCWHSGSKLSALWTCLICLCAYSSPRLRGDLVLAATWFRALGWGCHCLLLALVCSPSSRSAWVQLACGRRWRFFLLLFIWELGELRFLCPWFLFACRGSSCRLGNPGGQFFLPVCLCFGYSWV